MIFKYECLECNIKQALKVSKLVLLDEKKEEMLIRDVLTYLANISYEKTNPEIMGGTWKIIVKHIGNNDPYKDIRYDFNNRMLKVYSSLYEEIVRNDNSFYKAMFLAIHGNVIDFGANHTFSTEELFSSIKNNTIDETLSIDHSKILYERLSKAKKLLYIGDNCGEIVLDKLFIEVIKIEFPNLDITFSVRGEPVLNDAVMSDALMLDMESIVNVINDGNCAPGTLLNSTSAEFRNEFDNADVIISKGQGNYESLSEFNNPKLFFLLMVKCDCISRDIGINTMDKICLNTTLK